VYTTLINNTKVYATLINNTKVNAIIAHQKINKGLYTEPQKRTSWKKIIMSNRFYCTTKQRFNNILIYLNNFMENNYNKFKLKNLRILARHKGKTPWRWHKNFETYRSMYYTKRYFCDIIVRWLVVIKEIQKGIHNNY